MLAAIRHFQDKCPKVLLVFTLALTMLLSCAVRNAIQTSLDIPVSKPLNMSKTLVSAVAACSSIVSFEAVQSTHHEAQPPLLIAVLLISLLACCLWSDSSPARMGPLKACEPSQAIFLLHRNLRI